jgi:hypothetical protein
MDPLMDESHEQFSDSLEVSNIPEAFEKDETPDPREIQSNNEIAMDQTVAQKVLAEETPLESMDPYDPFCSTSPNVATTFFIIQVLIIYNPFIRAFRSLWLWASLMVLYYFLSFCIFWF